MRNDLRNMILTLTGKGVSELGSKLFAFAMSFYVLKMTGSAQSFAVTLILMVLPQVILGPFVGNIVDRMSKKVLVVGADVLSGILMFAVYWMSLSRGLELWMIYLATFGLSVFYVFLSTAYSAAYPALVNDENLTKINSYSQGMDAILAIITPIMGGALYAVVDPAVFLLVNGISFIGSAISELFIDFTFNSKIIEVSRVRQHFLTDMKEGILYIWTQKGFMTVAFYALVINFFLSSFSVIMPYNIINVHHLGATDMGLIEGAFPLGAVIMSILVGYLNMKFSKGLLRNTVIAFGVMMAVFAIPVLPHVNLGGFNTAFYAVSMFFCAFVIISVNVPLSVLMQKSIEEQYRGRVSGFMGSVSQAVVPLSYVLTGFMVGAVPSFILLLVVSGVMFATAVSINQNNYLDGFEERTAVRGELVEGYDVSSGIQ